MANWCVNHVAFTASEERLKEIEQLFKDMEAKQRQEVCGQLPPFVQATEGYCFDIDWAGDDIVYYETKWSPNTEILKQVADKFDAGFEHFYEELGCLIYGEATYSNGVLTDVYLDEEDFAQYDFLEDKNRWKFENELYESDYEILEILLERKKSELSNK